MDTEQENIRGHADAWRVGGESDAEKNESTTEREFLVRRSTSIAYGISQDLFAKMFSHLFPFVKECVKHYISLSQRQFAEDDLFTLVAFDCISEQNMNTQKSIRCKRYPGMYEDFESVGVEQLGNALLENERRRQGCLPRRQQCDRVTNSFLKTVELATSS
ncbi:hypothetical protein JG688_00011285, partial [Phytophthora aleatoria]